MTWREPPLSAQIRGIDTDRIRQVILRNTLVMLEDLGIAPICEGVETRAELATVQDLGVRLVQGYALGCSVFDASTIGAGTGGTKVPLAAA